MPPLPLPDLTGLPQWAQILCYGILAISLGLVYGTVHIGLIRGKTSPQTSASAGQPATFQLAGAIMSHEKADALLKAIESQGVMSANLAAALKENTAAVGVTTAAINAARSEIDDARKDVRDLTLELARSGRP